MMYYNVAWFRARVDRIVLPSSQHYRRVRAVFELYGPMVDEKTGKPLFNAAAWKKANNVLKEILLGHCADMPGISFYRNKLNARGGISFDALGLALIECSRGTNDVECVHKQIVTAFGGWCTGVEMADALLAEFRHRYNHSISERRRLGFPVLGHVDTWLIDKLQVLVERNHGVLLHPEWTNASDYRDTPESFGTVSLHSEEIAAAIDAIVLPVLPPLTGDMKYLCSAMHTKLPPLPVDGKAECQLFSQFVLKHSAGPIDFDAMAIAWCDHVNGVDVFPKLPVYLRTYYATSQRNARVRDLVSRAAPGEATLRALNEATLRRAIAVPAAAVAAAGLVAAVAAPRAATAAPAAAVAPDAAALITATASPRAAAVPAVTVAAAYPLFAPIGMPPTMPRVPEGMTPPSFVAVGGTALGIVAPPAVLPQKRGSGKRGADQNKTMRIRHCKKCRELGHPEEQQVQCAGAAGVGGQRPRFCNP
jgi:hypothetical protein